MSEDELERRERQIAAAYRSLGRRVVRHNEIRKATADFDDEGHRRSHRGKAMNNKPFDAGLQDLVSTDVFRRAPGRGGYWRVSDEERFAEDLARAARGFGDAVAVLHSIPQACENVARVYRLTHPSERIAKSRATRRLRQASGIPFAKPGHETWGDFRERVRQLEEFFRPGLGREPVR